MRSAGHTPLEPAQNDNLRGTPKDECYGYAPLVSFAERKGRLFLPTPAPMCANRPNWGGKKFMLSTNSNRSGRPRIGTVEGVRLARTRFQVLLGARGGKTFTHGQGDRGNTAPRHSSCAKRRLAAQLYGDSKGSHLPSRNAELGYFVSYLLTTITRAYVARF